MTTRRSPGGVAPKLTAIAREAGVSPSTVSKVINGRTDVSMPTRTRVLDILRRRGYRRRTPPNHWLLDLLIGDLTAPYAGRVIAGAERAARRAKADVVVCTPGPAWLDRVAARGSAGVLLAGARLTPPQETWLADHHLPVATIDVSGDPLDGELCLAITTTLSNIPRPWT